MEKKHQLPPEADPETLALLTELSPGLDGAIKRRIAQAVAKKEPGMCRLASLLADTHRGRGESEQVTAGAGKNPRQQRTQ